MLKTSRKRRSSGFTLVEMVIAVVILGILTSIGLPSFVQMLRNAEIRNAAESISNGLQKARAEAVTRNASTGVAFVLGTGTAWSVVNVQDGTVVESRSAKEGSSRVVATTFVDLTSPTPPSPAPTTVTFNNLGQVMANADASATLVRVNLDAGNINDKKLQVRVGAGGNTKMCDPSLTSGSSPRAC